MGIQKYRVTGVSGQTEVIEAHTAIAANGIFLEHHGEPAVGAKTSLVHEMNIVEEDTARG